MQKAFPSAIHHKKIVPDFAFHIKANALLCGDLTEKWYHTVHTGNKEFITRIADVMRHSAGCFANSHLSAHQVFGWARVLHKYCVR